MNKETPYNHIRLALLNILFVLRIKFRELFEFGLRWWWWKYHIIGGFLYAVDSCYQVAWRDSKAFKKYTFLNFGYGESPPSTLKAMFDPIKPRDYGLFIDLGSGRGMAVFSMYFLYGIKAVGVEILPTHCSRSRRLKSVLRAGGVEIVNTDVLNFDFSRRAIYYSATTSFEDNLISGLSEKLKTVPKDSVIVMVHKPLEGPEFELFHRQPYPFTWGYDTVYFYRRTPY